VSVTESQTIYENFNAGGYAEQFNFMRFKANATLDVTHSYTKTYQKRESWLETGVSGNGTAAIGKVIPADTFSTYDVNSNRILVEEKNNLSSTIQARQMIYAADGTLLQKRHGTQDKLDKEIGAPGFKQQGIAHHFSSSGNYLGEIAKTTSQNKTVITSTLKDQHFSVPSENDNSNVTKYQVGSGDTLRSLALAFYGNSDYWYLIANVNGLTANPEEKLTEGLAIDIPARANSSNSATSFKPMDLQKIIGDTTPSLPFVPPPPAAGCNALAMVVMIAITVVATIATAGAVAALAPNVAFSMGLGVSTLAGGSMVAAAAGGFVGSVAGQLAGKAMGVVDSFSLKNALASGLTAGATAGLGNLMGVGSNVASGTFSGIVKGAEIGTTATLNLYGKMAMAASAVGFNVAANKLVGNNQASFQWRNVVTAAATAGAMHKMGITDTKSNWSKATSNLDFGGDVLNGFAGAAVGYGVSKGLYNEGSWNFRNVATDVFGNALGNSIVSKLSGTSSPQQAEKKAKAAAQQAVLSGASPQEARAIELQTYARESGGTVEAVAASGGKTGRGSFAYDSDDGFWLSNGTERVRLGWDASMNDVSDFLGNSGARDLGMQYASSRLVAKQASDAAFARGVTRGEQAYQKGYQERMANSGRIDFDLSKALAADNAMWGRGRQNAANFNRVMNNPYVVGTIGALQTLEGAVLTATGAAMSATGWGALAGVPIAAFGADQMQAGLRTVYNRQYTDSFANQGLQAAGLSPTQAGIAEAVLGGVGASASAMRGFGRLQATSSKSPLSYDITRWGEYGLPSDGTFVRTLTPQQYRLFKAGRDFDFAGGKFPTQGYPNGMGFIGSAEEVRHIDTVSGYREALKLDYNPKILMEFQLKDPARLQNVLNAPFDEFVRGGKTGAGFLEWNYPGIKRSEIINPTIRVLK
jgi:hypothetical protein